MENFDIYKEIAERTQGDIYVGVVGPVRTGKSTFIKRFMDLMVIPNIDNPHKQERAKDELPQSASGKTIHTTEPKFIPNEAVEILFDEDTRLKVRMVDCVGYIVKGALGYKEGETPKMVNTPWYEHEIPFEEAAEIGTKKVITDHSTIGIVVTTDGSITGISRNDYLEAEERVIKELKAIKKPFIIVLNSNKPKDKETIELQESLMEKYDVPVQILDVMSMSEMDIDKILETVLKEFPIKEIEINMPQWIEKLSPSHWLKEQFMSVVREMCKNIFKVRDVKKSFLGFSELDFLENSRINDINLGCGTVSLALNPESGLFYKILSEVCSCEIRGEDELLDIMREFNEAKLEYDKIKDALRDVRETGYGMVAPQLTEMRLEKPEKVKGRNGYGVKLKASAPSLHLIKADIETEVSPIMGTEKESEELVQSILEQFDNDPSEIWQSNMFGKSLEELCKEGLQKKLYKMPEDVQTKIQRTLEKIINDGNGGLICIIL
ncbi:stage IV sporulation protein A [Clostridium collagenovorans DSM 3089]|uniref:Stage IV sporulation protein A n=1 Tax=Clostridium collagenovorans DSM 3089 TaxID=1121306 RepID=A0A1M5SR69_9CLOT|nr:stage IV sporulation protein A [Clostridium collagenovorans]SHH40985.1 stage IV sporulation protein A [Clostridium collagenovorans DSM 3089]